MATGTLVAKIRAHKTAQERLEQARHDLDQEIARAVNSGEWQIIDVAEVTGWSRETIRAIVKRAAQEKAKGLKQAENRAEEETKGTSWF
jgi:predicted DNA-binding ArsR family transcriptional regulator